jgi:hypothetical protein
MFTQRGKLGFRLKESAVAAAYVVRWIKLITRRFIAEAVDGRWRDKPH